MAYDVFISYSREDSEIMQKVEEGLRAAGFTIWTDRGIHPGSPSWKTDIEKAIQESGCLVVLFSPDATESRWVRAELDYADAQNKPIYPLLVRGDSSNAIPFGFTSHQRIDLRNVANLTAGLQQLVDAINGESAIESTRILTKKSAKRRGLLPVGMVLILLILGIGVLVVINRPSSTVTPTQTAASGAQMPTLLPTMPPFVLPDGYKKVDGEKAVVAVPTGWATDIDESIIVNTLMSFAGRDAQSVELTQLILDGLDIYAASMLRIQGTAVSIEDTGIPLSYAILEERQRALYAMFDPNGKFIAHGLIATPAGEMLFTDGIGADNATTLLAYALIRGSLIYNIYVSGRLSDRDTLLQMGETIAQSFRIKE